jgi:hypothetical protein
MGILATIASLAILLVWHLVSMLLAGMKGRDRAKVRWTMTCTGAAVIWMALCAYTIAHDSEGAAVLAAFGIFVGLIAAYVLNMAGKFCIDFMAVVVLPDNRDAPSTQVDAEPIKAAD